MDDLVFQYFGQHLTWSIQNFAAGIDFASDFACRTEDMAQYIVSLNTILVKLYYNIIN